MIRRHQPPELPDPPPGWRRTRRPLSIAMLGWARLAMQAREGSGYNLSASELAAGLVLSGHRVSYLASGLRYSLRPWMHVRRRRDWRGVACYDAYNSPNLAPAAMNFRNMARELRAAAHTRLVLRWLRRVEADVVHIHSLEGFGLDLVAAIRRSGRPVVVTPHNYWYVCPQVDLLHRESSVCLDYGGGEKCAGCLEAPRPAVAVARRTIGQTLERVFGVRFADTIRKGAYGIVERVLEGNADPVDAASRAALSADPEAALGFDPGGGDGRIEHGLRLAPGEQPRPVGASPIDQNERFLAAEGHLRVIGDYGKRRLTGVAALNAASLVTPPSDFVGRVYARMGVDPRRIRTVRLGQPHFDQIHRRVRRSPFYDDRPLPPAESRRAMRFAFLGTTRSNKGLEVLARTIPLLPRDVRQQCVFHVRAAGWDWPFRKRLSPYPEVSYMGAYDTLQLIAATGEYDVGIVPHIWLENSPLVLLEHLHAGKFVLCSRLGGPPEWIVEPGSDPRFPLGNGVLFAGGDHEALAQLMTKVVGGEIAMPSPREVHEVTPNLQTWPGHVAAVEGVYREILGGAQPSRPPPEGPPAPRPALASRA